MNSIKDYSEEDIIKIIEGYWTNIPDKSPVLATGRGGVIIYYELLKGRDLTIEEKDSIEEGWYLFKDGIPIKQ